jgi:hypothetical protein
MAVLGVLAVVVLLLAGTNLAGLWSLPGEIVAGCELVRPEFARIKCEPISHAETIKEQISFGAEDWGIYANYRIKCGDDENSPACNFYASCDPQVDGDFYYQLSGDPTCEIGSSGWCIKYIPPGQRVEVAHAVPVNSVLQIGACKKFGTFYYAGKTYTGFIPYGLNVYDSGAAYRYNTQSCSLSDWGLGDSGGVVTNCYGAEGCEKAMITDALQFDDWVNYVIDYSVINTDLSHKVVDYGGVTRFCQVNQIYDFSRVDVASGNCYMVPDKIVPSDIECCPGMQAPDSECGDDFKWHSISQDPQCGKISTIECYGQGSWVTDYSTPETDAIRATGIDGNGCCIYETKAVQCEPPNIGCSPGWICNINKGFICEEQVGPGVSCGDGVCSPSYENYITCPDDCPPPQPFEFDWNILWIIILAVLLGSVGYLAKGGVGALIGGIAGGLAGYAVYWFMSLPWWAQVLIGIGGVAGAGILTYVMIFGGGFLAIIVLISVLRGRNG